MLEYCYGYRQTEAIGSSGACRVKVHADHFRVRVRVQNNVFRVQRDIVCGYTGNRFGDRYKDRSRYGAHILGNGRAGQDRHHLFNCISCQIDIAGCGGQYCLISDIGIGLACSLLEQDRSAQGCALAALYADCDVAQIMISLGRDIDVLGRCDLALGTDVAFYQVAVQYDGYTGTIAPAAVLSVNSCFSCNDKTVINAFRALRVSRCGFNVVFCTQIDTYYVVCADYRDARAGGCSGLARRNCARDGPGSGICLGLQADVALCGLDRVAVADFHIGIGIFKYHCYGTYAQEVSFITDRNCAADGFRVVVIGSQEVQHIHQLQKSVGGKAGRYRVGGLVVAVVTILILALDVDQTCLAVLVVLGDQVAPADLIGEIILINFQLGSGHIDSTCLNDYVGHSLYDYVVVCPDDRDGYTYGVLVAFAALGIARTDGQLALILRVDLDLAVCAAALDLSTLVDEDVGISLGTQISDRAGYRKLGFLGNAAGQRLRAQPSLEFAVHVLGQLGFNGDVAGCVDLAVRSVFAVSADDDMGIVVVVHQGYACRYHIIDLGEADCCRGSVGTEITLVLRVDIYLGCLFNIALHTHGDVVLYHVPGNSSCDHDFGLFLLLGGRSGCLILVRVVADCIRRLIGGITDRLVAGPVCVYVPGIQNVGRSGLAVGGGGSVFIGLRTFTCPRPDLVIDLGSGLVLQVGLLLRGLLAAEEIVDPGRQIRSSLIELAQVPGNISTDRCRDRVGDILIIGIALQIQIAADIGCAVHECFDFRFREVDYNCSTDRGLVACRVAAGLRLGICGRCAVDGQVSAVLGGDLRAVIYACGYISFIKYDDDCSVNRYVVNGRCPAGVGHTGGCVHGICACYRGVQTLLGMIRDDVRRAGFRCDPLADVGFGHIVDVGENDGCADADAFAIRVLGTSLGIRSDQGRVNHNIISGYEESIRIIRAGILDGDGGLFRTIRLGVVQAAILDLEAGVGSNGHIDRVRLLGLYAAGRDDIVFIGQEYLILGEHALLDIVLELFAQRYFMLGSLKGDLDCDGIVLAQGIDLGLLDLIDIGLAFDRCQQGRVFRTFIRAADLGLQALDGIKLKAAVGCDSDGVAAVALFVDRGGTVLCRVDRDLVLCLLLVSVGPDCSHVGGRTSIRVYGSCRDGLDIVVIDGLDVQLAGNVQGLVLVIVGYISSGGSVHEFHGQGTCNAYVYSTGAGNSGCLSIVCCLGSGVAFCFRLFDLCQNVEVLGCDLLGGNIDIVLVMRVVDRYRYAYALIGIDSFTTCQGDCIGLIETKYIDILFRCDRACVCDIRFGNIVEVVDQEGCCNFNGAFTGLCLLSVCCLVVQCGGICAGQTGSARHVERRGSRAVSYLVSLPVRAVSFRTGSSGS